MDIQEQNLATNLSDNWKYEKASHLWIAQFKTPCTLPIVLCEIENSLEYTCYTCGYFITLYQDDVMSDSSVQDPSLTNHIQNEVGLDRGSALSKFTCTNSLHEFHANL